MLFGGARRRKDPQARVILTSMMDMFTIILVFLLYNFSSEEQEFTMAKNLDLPASSTQQRYKDSISVTISTKAIVVADKEVAQIRNGRIRGTRVKGKKIHSVYKELRRHKAVAQYKIEKEGIPDREENTVVMLQADKGTPYRIVDMVLKSAGMAGYPKFRFAVIRRDL